MADYIALIALVVVVLFVALVVAKSVTLVPQAEAAVIERLGRYSKTVSGQLTFLVPFVDRVRAKVDLRERVVSFPPQPVITQDNLTVSIDTVVYFQVTNPQAAVYEISNYIVGVEQLTTTTLRNVVGGMTLEETLTSRDSINGQLRGVLDEATGRWGLRVARVELKSIDPPPSIQESMEKQMKADREKRATILTAEGNRESSIKTAEGAKQSQILSAEGAKQAAILEAEGERQSRILRAQGERAAKYLQAQGEAKAIEKGLRGHQGGQADAGATRVPVLADAAEDGAGRRQQDVGRAVRLRRRAEGLRQAARRPGRRRRVPVRTECARRRPEQAGGRFGRGRGVVHHQDRSGHRRGRRRRGSGGAQARRHFARGGGTGSACVGDRAAGGVVPGADQAARQLSPAGRGHRSRASPMPPAAAAQRTLANVPMMKYSDDCARRSSG